MSIQVPALELHPSVDLFRFTDNLKSVMSSPVMVENCDVLLEELVNEYDKKFLRSSSAPSLYSIYRSMQKDFSEKEYRYYNPVYSFVQFEGRVFVVSSVGLNSKFRKVFDSSAELTGCVLQDYSFYNSTDQQVSSGELTYEEWRERADFWHKHAIEVDRESNITFTLFRREKAFPGTELLEKRLTQVDKFSMEQRRERLAKAAVADKAMAEALKDGDETYRFFEIYNNIVSSGFPGWEMEEQLLPELPPLSF